MRATVTVLTIFWSENLQLYIKREVDKVWGIFKEENDVLFLDFVESFLAYNPVETLVYIQQKIENIAEEKIEIDKFDFEAKAYRQGDKIINILSRFGDLECFQEAIQLILVYCKKRQTAIIDVINAVSNRLGIDKDSFRTDYYTVTTVIRILVKECDADDFLRLLFIKVAEKLLGLFFQPVEQGRNNLITMYRIPVQISEGAKAYRSLIWEKLLELFIADRYQKEIWEIIDSYASGSFSEMDMEVLEFDKQYISKIICCSSEEILPFKKAIVCNRLEKIYQFHQIDSKETFEEIFENKEWKLYSILSERCFEVGLDYNEFVEKRKARIKDFALNIELDGIQDFIISCNLIVNEPKRDSWQFTEGIELVFKSLEERTEVYFSLVYSMLAYGDSLDVFPPPIITTFIKAKSVAEVFEMINKSSFKQKNHWLFCFFTVIHEKDVDEYWLNEWFSFLKCDSDKEIKSSIVRDIKFLENFLEVDSKVFINSARIILKKFNYNQFIASQYFEHFFNEHYFKPEELLSIFKEDVELLRSIYFQMISYSDNTDYSGSFIRVFIEADETWLSRYTEYVICDSEKKTCDYSDRISACWESDKFLLVFDQLFYMIAGEEDLSFHMADYFKNVLISANKDGLKEKQLRWLNKIISENAFQDRIKLVFIIVSELSTDVCKSCILKFIELNKDAELFKQLSLEPSIMGSSDGSFVPELTKKIDFYESLLPHFTGLELLEHKKLINTRIESLKGHIEEEQIRVIRKGRY